MQKSKNKSKKKNVTSDTRTPRPISAKEKLSVEVKSLSSQIAMLTNIMIENRNDEKVKSSRDPELQEIKKLLSRNQSELDSLLSEKRSEEKEQKNIELEKLTAYTDAAEESYKNGNLVSGLILSFLGRNEKSKEKIKQEQEIERNKRIDELKEQNKKLSDQKKILLNVDQNIVQSNENFTNSVQDSLYAKKDSDDISKNILSETQKTNSLLSNILRVTVVDFEDTALEKLSKVIKESIPPPSSDNNSERQRQQNQPRTRPNLPPIPPGNPNKIPTFRQIPGGLPMSTGALAAGAAISIGLGYGFFKGLNADQQSYGERRKKEQESKVEKAQRETANEDAKIRQKIKSEADKAISMYRDQAKTPEYAEAAAEQSTGKEKAAWLEIARERRTNPVATPVPTPTLDQAQTAENPPATTPDENTGPSPNTTQTPEKKLSPKFVLPKAEPLKSIGYEDAVSPSKIIIEGPAIIQLSKLQRKLFSDDLAAGIRKASSDSGELDALSDNIEDLSEKIEDPSIFSKISFSPSISSPYKPAGDKPTGSGTGEKDKTKESGSGTGGETEPQSTNVTPTSPTRVKDLKTQEIKAIQQLIQTESGGENIINKKTYDAGYFQFSPSTAWELMGRPDIQGVTKGTRGYSFSEEAKKEISRRVLDKSKDEQFSMYQKYIEPLKKANIPITFENIKTYGFASSSGLSALKSQDPNSVIYSPQWVNDKRDKKGFQHFGEMADLSEAGGAITLKGMQEWSRRKKPQQINPKVLEIVPNIPTNTTTPSTNRNTKIPQPQMLASNNESGTKTYTNAATAADITRMFASYDASSIINNFNSQQIISGQNGESSRKRPDDPYNHLINKLIVNT